MRFTTFISAFALLAAGSAIADTLHVEKLVVPENCSVKTKKGDAIEVHYEGKLASDGSVFDASHNRGQPLGFKVGSGQVIKGWDQGLLDMCVGEKRKLTIPPDLAYGERGFPPVIPPASTLIFETELISINGQGAVDKEL